MRNLTATRSIVLTPSVLFPTDPGTCRILLPADEPFQEIRFDEPATHHILETISNEVGSFQINRVLFEECPASLYYSEPYLKWFSVVLGDVYSDRQNRSYPSCVSELNRSFALRIISIEPSAMDNGTYLTLLLPPLWRHPDATTGAASLVETDDMLRADGITENPEPQPEPDEGLCLLRHVGSGRFTGKVLRREHEDGFRRIFSPEAVL